MLEATLTTLLGVVFGIITGFYFERRATLAARSENAQLTKELEALRTRVGSRHGFEPRPTPDAPADISTQLVERANAIQDPSGRWRRSKLASELRWRDGFGEDEIQKEMDTQIESGIILETSDWMEWS